MRITKETLLRVARETVSQRTHAQPDLVAVYLTGSLLGEDPLLGNTTDIDLVFVHPADPPVRREIVPLSAEIHLDIKHNPRNEYEHPRGLRTHPWLGPEMYAPLRLYDAHYFIEYVQAGIRERFFDPLNAYQRGLLNAQHARSIWTDLSSMKADSPKTLLAYLKSVNHAANALAVIKDSPLSERRFLLEFQAGQISTENEGLSESLYGLLGAGQTDKESLAACLPAWEQDFLKAGQDQAVDVRLHPARLGYYRHGFEALLAGEKPLAILWPLLHTWSLAAEKLLQSERPDWTDFCQQLGLIESGFTVHIQKLDAFLDEVEKILEDMADRNGLKENEET